MRPPGKPINVNAMTRKIDVDNRIPLRNYYRIADNLLKQKLPAVIDELESLKPEFQRQLDKLNKRHAGSQQDQVNDLQKAPYVSESSSSQWPVVSNNKQFLADMKFRESPNVSYPTSIDFVPDESSSLNSAGQDDIVAVKDYHSGVGGSTMESVLSLDDGRWLRPAEELGPLYNNEVSIIRQPSPPPVLAKVLPEFLPISPSRVADPRPGPAKSFQDGTSNSNSYQHLHLPVKMMEDFLIFARENTAKNLETCGVLAGSLKNRVFHITTLIVPKQESTSDSCQTLNEEEIFEVQDKFSLFQLGWIHGKRAKSTGRSHNQSLKAIFLGSEKSKCLENLSRVVQVRLVASSQMLTNRQTHPSQTCFMSSVDLHTHYSYQGTIMFEESKSVAAADKHSSVVSIGGSALMILHFSNFVCASSQIMLPEAIAIVMAPKDESSPHGIFHLSDPGGVAVIRNCQQRGFHPHEEAEDGSPIYEHCSHVFMNPNLKFEIVDLR
ncbi:hypothetical protein RJ639_022216 [Escallonia herrerae]|uniref:JAB1/MPN/MOV34 metalloenzyme domain-containing protein n=1 Tax=Escallonia herrerae TaxID=1293975 RepID=A0AA88V792_9ASTE|nr:hypothetical protein RJ639_022216 [Escallonia herrerae]